MVKVICANCDKEIEIPRYKLSTNKYKIFCCSPSCRKTDKVRSKYSQAMIAGRGYPLGFRSASEYKKSIDEVEIGCLVCGKIFKKRRDSKQEYCGPVCANRSPKRVAKIANTKLARHGSVGYNNRYKAKKTCLGRYGTENIQQVDEFKEKTKKTCIERYGFNNPSKAPCVIEKIAQTHMDRFGSRNVFSSEYGKAKIKESMVAKYGADNPQRNSEIKRKTYETVKEKYKDLDGAVPSAQSRLTCLERYGNERFFASETGKMTDKNYIERYGYSPERLAELRRRQNSMGLEWAMRRADGDEAKAREILSDRINSVRCSIGRASRESLEFFLPMMEELRLLGIPSGEVRIGIEGSEEIFLHDERTGKIYLYDFAVPLAGTIVEYHGSQWHAKTEEQKMIFGRSAKRSIQKDTRKKELAEENGFDIIVVWDTEATPAIAHEIATLIKERMVSRGL